MALVEKEDQPEGFLVYTDFQTGGKGQRGNVWNSEDGKNLLFSFYLKPKMLVPKQAYMLNVMVGLAVVDVIQKATGLSCELKWPNDVYINDKKLAGILVETSLGQSSISEAVIGIGLNVNQGYFNLPTATSVFLETGKINDRESLLENLMKSVELYYLKLRSGENKMLIQEYYQVMRWRGELHEFSDKDGKFSGEIIGIDDTGRLLINTGKELKRFDVKEITFLN